MGKPVCCSAGGGLAFAIRDCGGVYPDAKYSQVYRFSFIKEVESKFPVKLLNVVIGFKVQVEVFPVVECDGSGNKKYFKSDFYVFECQDDYIVVSRSEDLSSNERTPELIRHFQFGESSVVQLADEYAYTCGIDDSYEPEMYLFTNDGHRAYLV